MDRKMWALYRKFFFLIGISVGILILLRLTGISDWITEKEEGGVQASSETETITPTHLGNGVYLFPNAFWGRGKWQRSLVNFIAIHPELRVTALYDGDHASYGSADSALVVTEPREQSPEKEK